MVKPLVTYHYGPLLPNIEIVSIFLSTSFADYPTADWTKDTNLQDLLTFHVNPFLNFIMTSSYLDKLAEYSADPYSIGRGRWAGSYYLSADQLVAKIKEVPVNADQDEPYYYLSFNGSYLKEHILLPAFQNQQLPPPAPNRSYFIFLPPGVICFETEELEQQVLPNREITYNGFHSIFSIVTQNGQEDVPYAIIDHPNTHYYGYSVIGDGPQFPDTTNYDPYTYDDITTVITHEMVEMVTNPFNYSGWHTDDDQPAPNCKDPTSGQFVQCEIGDICQTRNSATERFTFNGYQVASFWSNRLKTCIGNCEVQIRVSPTSCIGSIIEGTEVIFSPHISYLSPSGAQPAEYLWSWTRSPGDIFHWNLPTFPFIVPPANQTVFIQLQITDTEGHTASAEVTCRCVTPQQARSENELCQIFQDIRGIAYVNFFVNPLWDPLRDFSIRPVQGQEIDELRQTATRLFQLTERLNNLYQGQSIEPGTIEDGKS